MNDAINGAINDAINCLKDENEQDCDSIYESIVNGVLDLSEKKTL